MKLRAAFFILVFTLHCNKSEELAREGHMHLKHGRYISALTLFEQALKENRESGLALLGKGICLLQSPLTIAIGESLIKRSIPRLELEADKMQAYLKLAEAMENDKQEKKAHAYLLKAYGDGLSSEQFFLKFSRSFYKKKDYPGLLQTLQNGLRSYPESIELQYRNAVAIARYAKDYKKSASLLKKIPIDFYDNEVKLYNLLQIYFSADLQEDYQRVIDKTREMKQIEYKELVRLVEQESQRRRPSWKTAPDFH